MRKRSKILLFLLVLGAGLVWVAVSDAEQAEIIRALLRHVLRRLF